MLTLGMPNPTVEKTRNLSHLCAKKFVPVFERLKETYIPARKFAEQGKTEMLPRYERWGYNFWNVMPTSKPNTIWAIYRIRRARLGQLRLL